MPEQLRSRAIRMAVLKSYGLPLSKTLSSLVKGFLCTVRL